MQIAKCVLEFKSHVCSGKAITDSVEIICRCAIVVVNTLNSNSTPFVHTVYYQNRLLLLRFEWTRLDVKKRAKNKTKTQLKKINKRIETKITTTTKYLRHTKYTQTHSQSAVQYFVLAVVKIFSRFICAERVVRALKLLCNL